MSIFRRDSDSPHQPTPVSNPAPAAAPRRQNPEPRNDRPTHIAAGSKVVGQISGSAELVIEGQVEGEIQLENQVVVGSGGRVEGRIEAKSVQVGGQVVGNVRGLERVEVQASGRLEGDVVAPRVVIAEGAFFKGKVEMTEKVAPRGSDKPESRPPAESAKPASSPGPVAAASAKPPGAAGGAGSRGGEPGGKGERS